MTTVFLRREPGPFPTFPFPLSKEIARALAISPATVRSHLQAVYAKLKYLQQDELARSLGD
ncbi:MAG: response regulator transcription factor [Burkholderiales bacterium]|nr:response regulator transcription factor [Burkholderiales bacterium]